MPTDIAKARTFYQRREHTQHSRQHLVTSPTNVHYGLNVPEVLGWQGTMNGLIKRIGAVEIAAATIRFSPLV
jgi:hypothetical protein